jgi:hypothetical protein
VRIAILVEGRTETAFKPHLIAFLEARLAGQMPKLDMSPYDGRIPKGEKLRRTVEMLLLPTKKTPAADAVIALTDVYTGTDDFSDAADAKQKMCAWVGSNPRFYPHVAKHDFEAWLLPYWNDIQRLAGHDRKAPPGLPESVNHNRPPSYHVKEIFEVGSCRDSHSKPRDAKRILQGNDLAVAIAKCPELKSFVNTIIQLSGGTPL